MYNHSLTLIHYEVNKDEIGNDLKEKIEMEVLCKVKDIGSNEYYDAQVVGLKPALKFVIHTFEYGGQKEVEFDGNRYKVMRTFSGESLSRSNLSLRGDEIELTCEGVR